MIDEVVTVVAAAETNGRFEQHHREDLDIFLKWLARHFERHAHYEEKIVFEDLKGRIDERRREAIEEAIDQHCRFTTHLDEALEHATRLEVGDKTDVEAFRELADRVDKLETLWDRHDETEHLIFDGETDG